MELLLVFAAVLLVAVLVSSLARRTVLSTAVVFLVAGFALGPAGLGAVDVQAEDEVVVLLAELALFAVLFSDGMRLGVRDLVSAWRLPGRALALGMPLTLLVTALFAHYVVGLDWAESFLVGAVLAPTDPVFASALVGNDAVPQRLRRLLGVESGINDGLALPLVVVLLSVVEGSGETGAATLALEIALGVLIGVGIPLLAIWLERLPVLRASAQYQPLNALAIGLLVLGLAEVTHANLFLAAFAAGVTVATAGHEQRESFEEVGELVAEVLKLAALLLFGALITPALLADLGWRGWAFAVLALVVARPVAIWVSFIGTGLGWREQGAAMWFGPKGFASVVLGLLVLNEGIAEGDFIFHLIAATIALSILLHSSTDVVVGRAFERPEKPSAWREDDPDTDPDAAPGTRPDSGPNAEDDPAARGR